MYSRSDDTWRAFTVVAYPCVFETKSNAVIMLPTTLLYSFVQVFPPSVECRARVGSKEVHPFWLFLRPKSQFRTTSWLPSNSLNPWLIRCVQAQSSFRHLSRTLLHRDSSNRLYRTLLQQQHNELHRNNQYR